MVLHQSSDDGVRIQLPPDKPMADYCDDLVALQFAPVDAVYFGGNSDDVSRVSDMLELNASYGMAWRSFGVNSRAHEILQPVARNALHTPRKGNEDEKSEDAYFYCGGSFYPLDALGKCMGSAWTSLGIIRRDEGKTGRN